jgi:hypothetical protein
MRCTTTISESLRTPVPSIEMLSCVIERAAA